MNINEIWQEVRTTFSKQVRYLLVAHGAKNLTCEVAQEGGADIGYRFTFNLYGVPDLVTVVMRIESKAWLYVESIGDRTAWNLGDADIEKCFAEIKQHAVRA